MRLFKNRPDSNRELLFAIAALAEAGAAYRATFFFIACNQSSPSPAVFAFSPARSDKRSCADG